MRADAPFSLGTFVGAPAPRPSKARPAAWRRTDPPILSMIVHVGLALARPSRESFVFRHRSVYHSPFTRKQVCCRTAGLRKPSIEPRQEGGDEIQIARQAMRCLPLGARLHVRNLCVRDLHPLYSDDLEGAGPPSKRRFY
jgi:hypothetical protein